MSDSPNRVVEGLIRSFRKLVDRVDPHDLVRELVQRRILPLSHLEQQICERRDRAMMRLLGRVYRQSMVDYSTYADFVNALESINTSDPGHRYEDIIQELRIDASRADSRETYLCDYLPFSGVERRVFDCTRRVAERSLEPDSLLPDLVSAGAITVEDCVELADQRKDRREQAYCLMDVIQKRGSHALSRLVHTLLESEDRSANGVGRVMQDCLEAQQESPHTPQQWLEHQTAECEAFQHVYAECFSHISDCDPHLTLVNCLYSAGLIDQSTRDSLTEPRKQRVNQIRSLLARIEDLIESRSGVYHQLVSLLEQEEECWFNQLGRLLRESYDKQVGQDCIILSEIVERDSCLPQVSCEMRGYQEEVRRHYMPGGEPGSPVEHKWPGNFTQQVIPTNLARITREKVYRSTADAFTQTTLHGNIDEIDQGKTPISKESLFEGSSRCIIAQGAAGIGKSMFTQELASDWATNKGAMRQFQLLCLVPLRYTCYHNISTVFDLFHPKPSMSVEGEILASEGEGLLLILDGFDELPRELQERNSVYGRLILGLELPKARILITSRPNAVKAIEHLIGPRSKQTLNVEILGFQTYNIESCVQAMLTEEVQQKAFLEYIEENMVIKNMMYIPLHTAIVIELFRQTFCTSDGDQLDTRNCAMTLTKLFRDLCRCLIYRDIASKHPNDALSFEEVQLENLPALATTSFETLCSHAFDSLSQQKLIFDKFPASFDHMGFMRSVTVQACGLFSPPRHSFSFHHLTIQEFLAAFYLWQTQQPLRQLEMVQQLPIDHQSMVQRFLAGLSQFSGVGWPLAMESVGICLQDSQENRGCNSTLLNCLFEAQDPSVCQEVFPSGHTINFSPLTSTQFDCFALGYCIATSGEGCRWKLCAIGGKDLGAIAAGMRSVGSVPRGRIDLIKLSYGGEDIHNLGLFPECLTREIRELNLSNCGLSDEACVWLSRFLPSLSSLGQLDLGDNPFTGGSTSNIFVALSKLSSFQYLDLLHVQLDETDIEALRTLTKENGSLKNLIIGRCQMRPSLVEKMVDVVLSTSCLESISFMNIDLPRLATHLAKRLEGNTTLESVMLWDRSFCTDGALKLLGCLKTNKALLSMTLMPWYQKNIPEHILLHPSIKGRVQWFIYPKRKRL